MAPERIKLIEFPGGTPVLDPRWHRSRSLAPDAVSFIRPTEYAPPRFCFRSLAKVLAKTEEQFKIIEELCGVQTVPHTWGLVPEDYYKSMDRRQAKPGRRLVAEVAIVTVQPEVPTEAIERLEAGLDAYHKRQDRYMLGDMFPKQFAFGHLRGEAASRADNFYLLDIEPIFMGSAPRIT